MSTSGPHPDGYAVTLPPWFAAEVAALPSHLHDPEERIRLVNRLAARTVAEGTGGPFAALVVDVETDAVLAAGVNLVLASGLATSHAEVVALSLAQTRTGAWNLGADPARRRALVVNAQPCAMCLGALLWSGIGAVEFAATGADVERLTGFDEGPVPDDWRDQLERRGVTVTSGRLRDEAFAVLRDFRDRVDRGAATLYNGG